MTVKAKEGKKKDVFFVSFELRDRLGRLGRRVEDNKLNRFSR